MLPEREGTGQSLVDAVPQRPRYARIARERAYSGWRLAPLDTLTNGKGMPPQRIHAAQPPELGPCPRNTVYSRRCHGSRSQIAQPARSPIRLDEAHRWAWGYRRVA